MFRLLSLTLVAVTLCAQTSAPSASQTLDKPPQDVDDALRARIKQFYDFHVAAKFRQAEQLIAEESKDDFYVLSKPELKSYKIGKIEYSDNFTKAKVIIVGSMPVLLPMAGGKLMDMPFASFWKIEDGQWFWYYNKQDAMHTPFGDAKPSDVKPGNGPTALPAAPTVTIEKLQSALQVDRTYVELSPGKSQEVRVTNTLPGPASLAIQCPYKPIEQTGITARFDKKNLKGNETAVLTLSSDANTPAGRLPLQITVAPTNQVLNLTVSITR
ncbi:MAG TPA: hypothetical protein VGL72_27875 [Bryobacteraceae bacterium]|jgi:hypothetical protein